MTKRATNASTPKAAAGSPAAKGASTRKAEDSSAAAAPLIVSISGIRGIAGQSFTPTSIVPYIDAFARMIKGKRVVVGYDARPSHKWVLPVVEGVLRSHGIDVLIVGLAATPTIGLLTRKLKMAGGIAITASHNPIEYNGLKFFHAGGEFITAEMLAQLKDLLANPEKDRPVGTVIGKRAVYQEASDRHLEAILEVLPPPERQRASRRPTVIIDCCNSAGVELAPDVADAYGALFQLIFADTSKNDFPRGAEPIEKNLSVLRKAVVKEGADIGFAIDPDADRLAVIDEKGNAIGEERTLLLAADAFFLITKKKSPIVVNLSTSLAIEEMAKRHGVKVYRTAIGEANVLAGIREHRALVGGEGNGGVILPKVQPGRDAATAIALILSGLQQRGGTISEWNESFPSFAMRKESVPLANLPVASALARVKKAFAKENVDTTDGVKITWADRWLHIRPSNTEPIVRLFSEAPTDEAAAELIEKGRALLSS
jgi:phosphomannomutase